MFFLAQLSFYQKALYEPFHLFHGYVHGVRHIQSPHGPSSCRVQNGLDQGVERLPSLGGGDVGDDLRPIP